MDIVQETQTRMQATIDDLTDKFTAQSRKGFDVLGITRFVFDCGASLVEAVEGLHGLTGEEKKQVVTQTVIQVYRKVNPNLPYVPEPFESMIENFLLNQALDSFIDFIVAKYRDRGIFQKKEAVRGPEPLLSQAFWPEGQNPHVPADREGFQEAMRDQPQSEQMSQDEDVGYDPPEEGLGVVDDQQEKDGV